MFRGFVQYSEPEWTKGGGGLRRQTSAGSHTFTDFRLILLMSFVLRTTTRKFIKSAAVFFFYCLTPPSSCPSALTPPPLTLHSFFYSPQAFPLWPKLTIVVFPLSVCVRSADSLFFTVHADYVHLHMWLCMTRLCYGLGTSLEADLWLLFCFHDQSGPLSSPESPNQMGSHMCVLLFLNESSDRQIGRQKIGSGLAAPCKCVMIL